MSLVTSQGYNLVPDVSPVAQRIAQVLQQKKEDEKESQLKQAAQVKEAAIMAGLQAVRVSKIKDFSTQRKEIAILAQDAIKNKADPQPYVDALNLQTQDELNLHLERNATRASAMAGNASKLLEQGLKEEDQFEPVTDAEGNIIAQRNIETGQVIADPRAGLRAKEREKELKDDLKATKDKFDRSSKLRAEVTKASTDFNKQRGAWARVQASGEDPSPAGDLALIFNFMKVLDPGSTVRESEFAQVGAAGSLPTQAQRVYDQYATGQKLTPEQRADVMGRAKKIFKSAEELNKKDIKKIISIGKQFNIPKKLIIGEEFAEEAGTITLPNGVVVRRVK
jgi:hypothetical protein